RGLMLPGPQGQLITVDSVSSDRNLAGATFTVTGTQSVASAAQLRSAGQAYPSFIERDGFLALPDPDPTGGIAAIHALAQQWTAQTTNPYDAATAIESHLRDPRLFRYTLSPPLPKSGLNIWPVTYFLTTSHAGYCQYFAAAMGTMLRSLGIPARLVNGYGPGSTSGAAVRGVENATTYTVTSNDAHTWVEAYFAGFGWVPFEPTPPSSAGDYAPFTRGTTVPSTVPPPTSASAAPTPTAGAASRGGSQGAGGGAAGVAVAVVLRVGGAAGALAVLVALFAAWLLRPRAVAGVWRRLALLGALAGMRREASLTFAEYADRLAAALPPGSALPRQALAEIAASSSRALYAREGGEGDAARAAAAWRRLVRALPRDGWRMLRRRRVTP
ncbi:MAG TPA: transglutaminase-like domain-containing protein, partial [Thermomicrobiaceae bacterium]|nr:transglutaminase-like domain-containing protein [Thermomicrobiaceae bacterium]